MKRLSIARAACAAVLIASVAACATDDPVYQRNMAELKQLEACGYRPRMWDPYYPDDLQKAEARLQRGECGQQ